MPLSMFVIEHGSEQPSFNALCSLLGLLSGEKTLTIWLWETLGYCTDDFSPRVGKIGRIR